MEEVKKRTTRNKTARILYTIYFVLFAGLAAGCYVVIDRAYIQIDVDVCSFPTMVIYWLGVGLLFYGILAAAALVHAIVSYCAKQEHNYLRISSKWALLVVMIITPLLVPIASHVGNVNFINDARKAESGESAYAPNSSVRFDEYAYSDSKTDEGSIVGVKNNFAMVVDVYQDLKERNLFEANFRYSKFPVVFRKMETLGDTDLIKPSGDDRVSKQTGDDYALYIRYSPETEDESEHTTLSLVVQADCSYFLAELETYNKVGEKEKKQFVEKSQSIYKAFLATAESH